MNGILAVAEGVCHRLGRNDERIEGSHGASWGVPQSVANSTPKCACDHGISWFLGCENRRYVDLVKSELNPSALILRCFPRHPG